MMYTLHAPQGFASAIGSDPIQIEPKADDARLDDLTAIPDGVAKWALILPPFWLAWHRLWGALIIYCAVVLVLLSLLGTGFAMAALVLGGIPGFYLFLEGNSLRRDAMARAGWDNLGVVEAADDDEAIIRFLAGWPDNMSADLGQTSGQADQRTWPNQPQSMTSVSNPDDRLAFGLFPDRAE